MKRVTQANVFETNFILLLLIGDTKATEKLNYITVENRKGGEDGLWKGMQQVAAGKDADVPPNIDDSLSSSDVIVREGANVTLMCHASGSPAPSVKWKRDDGAKININKSLSVMEWEGGVLELSRISRLDLGAYLCIASNGVPPTVSKRIKVSVDCEYQNQRFKL
ncbi:hypothetical protein RUM44_011580 [Polyplax serrata]|uniref:Ig-like domain-containing protein n=1 Tax=Polyplax serrata TaxID=468196 RepID=A0ABR1AQJ2_POLSC